MSDKFIYQRAAWLIQAQCSWHSLSPHDSTVRKNCGRASGVCYNAGPDVIENFKDAASGCGPTLLHNIDELIPQIWRFLPYTYYFFFILIL